MVNTIFITIHVQQYLSDKDMIESLQYFMDDNTVLYLS